MTPDELSVEMTLDVAMSPLVETLRPVHKALSHVTREVRPADAAFTRTTKAIRLLQAEVERLRSVEASRVAAFKVLEEASTEERAENAELRAENAELKDESEFMKAQCDGQRLVWRMSHKSRGDLVEWFERREALLAPLFKIIFVVRAWPETVALAKWIEANPKPGAGP